MYWSHRQASVLGRVCGRPLHHTACKQNFCLDAIECLRLPGLTSWVLADFGSITALHLCIANLTMDQVLWCFRDNLDAASQPLNGVTRSRSSGSQELELRKKVLG